MKQIAIVDSNGNIVGFDQVEEHKLDGSVVDNEDGTFTIYKLPSQPLHTNKFDFDSSEWVEGKSDTERLADVKQAKIEELDKACSMAILQGFDYTISGTSYHFSLSIAAQANLQGTDAMFKEGSITSETWTVLNNGTGEIERVTLDETTFNGVRDKGRSVIRNNVSKFRDDLQPQVEAATTVDEVEAIKWS